MPTLADTRHEAFAQHYALNGHIARAAEEAGLSTYSGYSLLNRPEVGGRIEEILQQRFAKASITADRVMKELARIAFADPRQLYDENGDLVPIPELTDDAAALIAGVKVEVIGRGRGEDREMVVTKNIKMADKMGALTLLARHFKIVGEDSDGVNVLANALADRLKNARMRDNSAAEDARVWAPEGEPTAGVKLEYAVPDDPSNADDVSASRLAMPERDPEALHFDLPEPVPQSTVTQASPGPARVTCRPRSGNTPQPPAAAPQGASDDESMV